MMRRSLPLLVLLAACTGPESAKKQYAYAYSVENQSEAWGYILVADGRSEHVADEFSERKLKPYEGFSRQYAYWEDNDLDGTHDLRISTTDSPDGSHLEYYDRGADGSTDRTHHLNERFQPLEHRFDGGFTLYTYDAEDRLLESETQAGNLLGNQFFSYQPEAPDWIGYTLEDGRVSTGVEITRVERRELGPSGRWVKHYVGQGAEERLFAERTLDKRDRTLTYTEYDDGAEVYTRTNTYEGDFLATARVEVAGELLWTLENTQDERGLPVVEDYDSDGDGIDDETVTTTWELDDYGRIVLEERRDEEGELLYRFEREDLGELDLVDLDPWKVEPRGLDDYE